jgi:hypothetical protein
MDFMPDELFDGRRIRPLTIVDHFTRESLAIKVEQPAGTARTDAEVKTRAGFE